MNPYRRDLASWHDRKGNCDEVIYSRYPDPHHKGVLYYCAVHRHNGQRIRDSVLVGVKTALGSYHVGDRVRSQGAYMVPSKNCGTIVQLKCYAVEGIPRRVIEDIIGVLFDGFPFVLWLKDSDVTVDQKAKIEGPS